MFPDVKRPKSAERAVTDYDRREPILLFWDFFFFSHD